MAQNRKYGTLPDLDSAPAVYATPELTDDAAVAATGASPSASPTSSHKSQDSDSDAGQHSRISRKHLLPSQARSQFLPARVDARGVDFSDRISDARKSYRVSHARRKGGKHRQNGLIEDVHRVGDGSDDSEEEEGIDERIARLRRETEEVQADLAKRKEKGGEAGDGTPRAGMSHEEAILQLSSVLRDAQTTSRVFAQQNSQGQDFSSSQNGAPPETTAPPSAHPTLETSSTSHSTDDLHTILTKTTTLESRLTSLESALGVPALTSGASDNENPPPTNITTSLAHLEKQLTTLTSTNTPTLDALAQQIHDLTASAEALTNARHAARQAQDALREKSASSRPVSRRLETDTAQQNPGSEKDPLANLDDREQSEKVNALYSTLSTIERLAPLLPGVLERLRTLRVLHADAAGAGEALAEVEKRQARTGEEIERWKGALRGMEEVMNRVGDGEERNKDVIEKWVRQLEERVDKLGREGMVS